jgi:hypothetical protein
MENKIAHLNMIQAVIQRLANASLVVRGWSVTLATGVFAVTSRDVAKRYAYLAYLPIVVFWLLDGFYLAKERAFRQLYDEVRLEKEEAIDFRMLTADDKGASANACLSRPILIVYGTLLAVIVILIVAMRS